MLCNSHTHNQSQSTATGNFFGLFFFLLSTTAASCLQQLLVPLPFLFLFFHHFLSFAFALS